MVTKNTFKLPEVIVFAGPNGSGKSTYTEPRWIIEPYINADNIKVENQLSDIDAAKYAEQLRENSVDSMMSFSFETVLSTERNLILLERAKEKGFFVRGYYIFTRNPAINIARVRSRVTEGGHDVPEDKIIKRYWRSRQLIPRFYSVCDILHIYDNSADQSPVRLVRKHKQDTRIFPNEYWSTDQLLEIIGLNQ